MRFLSQKLKTVNIYFDASFVEYSFMIFSFLKFSKIRNFTKQRLLYLFLKPNELFKENIFLNERKNMYILNITSMQYETRG